MKGGINEKISMPLVTVSTLLFIILISFAAADGFPTIVETRYGEVEGRDEGDVLVWKGIPYAKPPVGEYRWKRPDDPDPWSGIKQADEFCDFCPQYGRFNSLAGSEDCLYLNVWRPDSEETDLPVYFWIHGGGNSKGSASWDDVWYDIYDGANIAQKSNMVVVTINYRLGPLGWFTHPALRKGNRGSIAVLSDSGNYGTLDIIHALIRVKENIESFGGDPHNITIAGESAGGYNVLSLIISPLAGKLKLFHKAISQSGPLTELKDGASTITISEISAGEEHANQLILKLLAVEYGVEEEEAQNILDNMTDKEIRNYLFGKSAKDILQTYEPGMFKFPHCFKDGIVIHKDGLAALDDPEGYNQVPMIIGSNKEEQKFFMVGEHFQSGPPSAIDYQSLVESKDKSFWKPFCVDNIAKSITAHPIHPDVFAYRFDYGAYDYIPDEAGDIMPNPNGFNAWSDDVEGRNLALLFGAAHTLDIPFFMGNYFFVAPNFSQLIFNIDYDGYEELSEAMMAYVKNFAYTGDPNSPEELEVDWAPWSNDVGWPKRILLDADEDHYIIEMSTE